MEIVRKFDKWDAEDFSNYVDQVARGIPRESLRGYITPKRGGELSLKIRKIRKNLENSEYLEKSNAFLTLYFYELTQYPLFPLIYHRYDRGTFQISLEIKKKIWEEYENLDDLTKLYIELL